MVFILQDLSAVPGKQLCLGYNGSYLIGRRGELLDIIMKDSTVSKTHSMLNIKDGIASIEDLNSKRGTFINESKISQPSVLKNGDVIRFGIQNCKYCFIDLNWIIYMSGPNSKQDIVKETLSLLGIQYSESYESCTHYTTETINMESLKDKTFLNALVDRKPIVTSDFWINLLKITKSAAEMPNVNNYTPEIENDLKKQGIRNINSNILRRFLFDDIIFIYFDEESRQEVADVIEICGGQSTLYNKSNDFSEKLKSQNSLDYILIKNPLNKNSKLELKVLMNFFRRCNKHVCVVTTTDILLNILKVSQENYCEIRKNLKTKRDIKEKEVISISDSNDEDNNEEGLNKLNANKNSKSEQNNILNSHIGESSTSTKAPEIHQSNGILYNKNTQEVPRKNGHYRINPFSKIKNDILKTNQNKKIRYAEVLNKNNAGKQTHKNNSETLLKSWKIKYKNLEIIELS